MIDATLLFEQLFNGLQFGMLLFLLAAGLTLVFGIMGIINLAHGAFYMLGVYTVFWLVGYPASPKKAAWPKLTSPV